MTWREVILFVVSLVIIVGYGLMCFWMGMLAERKQAKKR